MISPVIGETEPGERNAPSQRWDTGEPGSTPVTTGIHGPPRWWMANPSGNASLLLSH